MSSSTRNPYVAANTSKARRIDIEERKYITFRGDLADVKGGRILPFYDTNLGSARDPERQEMWSRWHALTPRQQFAVENGVMDNPLETVAISRHDGKYFPVYYKNRSRKLFKTLVEACYECITHAEDVEKVWTGSVYLSAAQVLEMGGI